MADTVTIGYPIGTIDPDFHASILGAVMYDTLGPRRLGSGGKGNPLKDAVIGLKSTHVVMGRNKICRAFLDECKTDWLLFIDTDQTFSPDIIELMLDSADKDERPIVSALIMAMRDHGNLSPACAVSNGKNLTVPTEIPGDRWWKCIPGTGCTIIHRRVLEAMRAEFADKTAFEFFAYPDVQAPDGSWDTFGEDYTFMLRAVSLGFTPYVDTTIEVGHVKPVNLQPAMFPGRYKNVPPANVVVIPFKDKWPMTRDLVEQLLDQGDADLILLYNNGSTLDTAGRAAAFAAKHDNIELIDAKGLGIHEMWNAGAEEAATRFSRFTITFLNNDLRLDEYGFIDGLATALADHPSLVAVCPEYDGRSVNTQNGPDSWVDVTPLQGICANRYDGTGGLSGFAFMVKGEWFQAGWRFPEDAMWWYGDNLLTLSIDKAGGWYGMAHGVTVEHLDGGGQTGEGWVAYEETEQGMADRAAFLRHCRDDLGMVLS